MVLNIQILKGGVMRRKKSIRKVNWEIGKGLALVSQIAISFLLPLIFSIWLTRGMVRRWNLGNGYIVLGILIGLGVGISSVYNLIANMYDLKKERGADDIELLMSGRVRDMLEKQRNAEGSTKDEDDLR